jgi:hypothetical protein
VTIPCEGLPERDRIGISREPIVHPLHVQAADRDTAPDGFSGRRALNVNGFAGDRLIGGVTLIAEGDGS